MLCLLQSDWLFCCLIMRSWHFVLNRGVIMLIENAVLTANASKFRSGLPKTHRKIGKQTIFKRGGKFKWFFEAGFYSNSDLQHFFIFCWNGYEELIFQSILFCDASKWNIYSQYLISGILDFHDLLDSFIGKNTAIPKKH